MTGVEGGRGAWSEWCVVLALESRSVGRAVVEAQRSSRAVGVKVAVGDEDELATAEVKGDQANGALTE